MSSRRWIGQSVERVEDGRLLTGRGTFIDDHPPVAQPCHAAIVRSPHAHARIHGWDVRAALAMEGVVGVITGADVATACKPFGVGVTAPIHYFPTATDRARFVNLVRIEREILAQHRQVARSPRLLQVGIAALEEIDIGQHRQARRPSRGITARDVGRTA